MSCIQANTVIEWIDFRGVGIESKRFAAEIEMYHLMNE